MNRKTLLGAATLILALAPLGFAGVPGVTRERGPGAVGVEGHVRDARSHAPIGGAQVFIAGTVIGTLTDAQGHYALASEGDLEAGTAVTVTVRVIGFKEASQSVELVAAGPVTLDFDLEQAALRLQDIIVTTVDEAAPLLAESGRAGEERSIAQGASRSAPAPAAKLGFTVERGPLRRNRDFNTESYAFIEENRWKAPSNAPLSTFSIDVDRASYSNVRRFILDGRRPPVDAVRIEEMVNYFTYDYPEADGEHPFTISTEVSAAPWNEDHRLVRIGIQGERVDLEDLPPSNFVFLLDVSGSMRSHDKLPLLKKSLRLLINELRPEDRVSIVVYAGAAGLVLPSTSGRHKGTIRDAIEGLEAGGSTAGGAGIQLAYRIAQEHFVEGGNNRVILATDGDFNVGASSDSEMIRLIERNRDQGTFLTVLGFGMGNLKDSKMEAIADRGNGNYAYIDNLLEARKVLVTEMGGTLHTIAKDVKIQIEFNPARVQAYRLIGYENRLLAAEDFNDDTRDAGELGAGHTVTALYEVVPVGAPQVRSGTVDDLRYAPAAGVAESPDAPRGFDRDSEELMFVKLRYKAPNGERSRLIEHPVPDRVSRASADLRFAASVAAFGMRLRDSEQCAGFTLDEIARLARSAVGADRQGYRSEFVRLLDITADLELLGTPSR